MKQIIIDAVKWIVRAALFVLVWMLTLGKVRKPKPPTINTKPIGGDKDKARQGQEILDSYED